jgi:haloalkane dehalogenase
MRRALDWTFEGSWPHPPSWFDTLDGRMHFVDVGPRAGRPVVLVHGNPSWGYLYRHFIPPLVAAGHRVIVPDHLGFGRSDKPASAEAYRVQRHARRFEALIESLDLRGATICLHDWGGPIGLFWASRHPERVHSLVILNTWVHRPTGPVDLPLPLRLARMRGVGELLVKGLHVIVRAFLLGAGVLERERLTTNVRRAYLAPHRTWSARAGILRFPRDFPAGPEGDVAAFQDEIHRGMAALASVPVFIAWAGKDVVLGRAILDRWLADFPNATLLELPGSGHFLQEDAHELVIPAIVDFLDGRRKQDQPQLVKVTP